MGRTESAIVFLSLPFSPKSVSDETVRMSFLASATRDEISLVPLPAPSGPRIHWHSAIGVLESCSRHSLVLFFTTGSRMNAAAEPYCRPLTTPEHLNQAMDKRKPM